MPSFDYIIIGAGTAGCLLANRLSADAGATVLLVEAGEKDNHPLLKVPIGFGAMYANKRYNYCLNSEPEEGLADRQINQPRGKVLGGSSAINGMMYVRGQREDFDDWAALGNPGWAYDEILPYFLQHERNSRGANQWHGDDGEWPVSDASFRPQWAEWFLEAAENAGIPRNEDINAKDQCGIDYTQLTQLHGSRYSSARAFLEPIKGRSNLTVRTQAQVARLLIKGSRATGIEVIHNGDLQQITARRETIVSAGALHSPQILLLSGIGDKDQLQALGISVAHHLPGVGQNLQEHIGVDVVRVAQQGLTIREEFTPHRLIRALYQYLFKGVGVLTFNGALVSGFIHSSGDASLRPNCQIVFSPAATKLSEDGDPNKTRIIRGLTSMIYPVRPDARGSITLRSSSIDDAPVIRHGSLKTGRDCQEMIDAVKLQRKVFAQSILEGRVGKEIQPGDSVQADAEILDYVRHNARGCFHPVGSCKMGQDAMAVVDERLRVHGIAGLRVVDGSIMPTITSGNTNAPIAMIAEKAAAMIVADNFKIN